MCTHFGGNINQWRIFTDNLTRKILFDYRKFTSDEELNRHVSEMHTINAPRLSQAAEVSTNGIRVQKVSAGQSVEPSSPSTPTPVQTAAPAIMSQSQNAYQHNQYSAVNPHSTPAGPRPTVPSQQMYSTATYQQQPQQQTMQYMQSSHQRGMSYPQEYSQSAMHAGTGRPQGYAQNTSYSQTYGQPYGMQQQHTAYNSYGQPQFQQGYSTTGYPMQQQSPYGQAQPVSHQPYHHQQQQQQQQQQQHYSQPYTTQATHPTQNRHLPAPIPSQSQQGHPQDFAQQQRMVQQQQFAQQQQYMVQQQQQQFIPQTAGYHQRSLSHQPQSAHQPQQHQQQYQPPSPLTVVASQPYATVNPAYQQQAYIPPSSVAYSSSGHGSSLSNASSHGSTTTLTTAMEGVGLGLSGVTNANHGRVAAPTVLEGVVASGPMGYMNGNLQT
jgi:hypothetical protein